MSDPKVISGNTKQQPDPLGGEYDQFLARMRERFARLPGPLFATDATGLSAAYLGAMPEEHRQHYTCSACRGFMRRFGGLVTIGADGRTTPALWPDDEPGWHGEALRVAHRIVSRARVTGPFLSRGSVLGHPTTGEWRHMSVTLAPGRLHTTDAAMTSGQAMAARREDYRTLCRFLADARVDDVRAALRMLKDGALARSERFQAMAAWLLDLIDTRAGKGGPARDSVTWLALAKAPPGFGHVGNTVLGTLLEDIAAGKSPEAIRRAWTEKMDPLQYQRPQAAPTVGAIARAEKLVEQLGLAPSLRRRHARLDEVVMTWAPKQTPKPAAGGVFAHLQPKGARSSDAAAGPETTMTWEKFSRTVLPDALRIEALVPSHGPFLAMMTACDPDAPPILQWDRPEQRNPVSWYVYHRGSPASQWGLAPGWKAIAGICRLPHRWHGGTLEHQGDGVILVLPGMRDSASSESTLFPEILKAELREVRSVIEAHSRRTAAEDRDRDDLAGGLDLRKGGTWDTRVRVVTSLGTAVYWLDRWD